MIRLILAVWGALVLGLQGQAAGQETLWLLRDAESAAAWRSYNGQEFPGAVVKVEVDQEVRHGNLPSLRIEGDFTKGGNYVEASIPIKQDISTLSFWVRAPETQRLTIRLIDSSRQCHQLNLAIEPGGQWQHVVLPVIDFFAKRGRPDAVQGIIRYEYWGGAKDGKWHAPAESFHVLVGREGRQKRTLWLSQVQAITAAPVVNAAPAYAEGFETDAPAGWEFTGDVKIEAEGFRGGRALVLRKSEQTLKDPVRAVGPAFPVSAGQWQVKAATRSDLTSMDNSYSGSVALELLDAGGQVIRSVEIVNQFRVSPWKPVARPVEIPSGATQARFRVQINKETPGSFRVDELSAAPAGGIVQDDRIKRLMFTTAALGNLLLPTDGRNVTLTVLADRPLTDQQQRVSLVVRDFWGAEQAPPIEAPLQRKGMQKDLLVYEGEADLSAVPMQVGRYYELHGSIARAGGEPFTNYSSLAILPEAPANSFPPDQIPFTSRNWDNRIEAFVHLTHRLGVRVCGVWGNFEPTPPYKNSAPQLKLIEELGMGWMTGMPSSAVERRSKGWEKYDEKALREGVRKFIADYGHVRPMYVSLGNEPHNKGENVRPEIEAYRILYDEIKKIDPSIIVVGTSVGPVEDYFKAGLGQWCDVYDFHIYEDALSVRRTLTERYPALIAKYGHAKPIWSTELGLNSQGLSRQTVAAELFRKFAHFFAGGGQNVSWFGLLYPDPEGVAHDSFGSAHNVFDCRYNKYAPKLDAIAYYNAVNTILDKKFVADRIYGTDLRAFLFRNGLGEALQILFKDKGREDVFIPLAGVGAVRVIRIDGQLSGLDAGGRGITLTVSEDPVLITYEGGPAELPESLGRPAIALGAAPASLVRAEPSAVEVIVNDAAGEVSMAAQPGWRVEKQAAGNTIRFLLAAPDETSIRELDTVITLTGADGKAAGQLHYRPAVTGTMSIELLPVPVRDGGPAAVKLLVRNNSPTRQDIAWDMVLTGQQPVENGNYGDVVEAQAYFADTPSGVLPVEGRSAAEVVVPLAEVDPHTVYHVKASARDTAGRVMSTARPVAGFVAVPRAAEPVTLDGRMDEAVWQSAPVQRLDDAAQFHAFERHENMASWQSPEDLSADIRFAWDDRHLYVAVAVRDDIAGPVKADAAPWQLDGLQFLIDPVRTKSQKVGKYDYALAEKGGTVEVRCYLAADGSVQLGEVSSWKVATQRGEGGSITYEIAIPWSSLAPFQPAAGANLGLTLILNEDDGHGRDSFMTWFGNAHNKDIDKVGDLILVE